MHRELSLPPQWWPAHRPIHRPSAQKRSFGTFLQRLSGTYSAEKMVFVQIWSLYPLSHCWLVKMQLFHLFWGACRQSYGKSRFYANGLVHANNVIDRGGELEQSDCTTMTLCGLEHQLIRFHHNGPKVKGDYH